MEETIRAGEKTVIEEKTLIHIDGKPYFRSVYTMDFGPKNGVARVEVLDPCVTQEAQEKRRAAIVKTCQELIARGETI